MIHLGKNTKSTIISKGISAGQIQQLVIEVWFKLTKMQQMPETLHNAIRYC
jgi:hypothetical protein